ncbi:hypothetical protein [Filimonas effusa]|uniref:DUF4843 domain-containing protein n=1 Tax=Filimonas effusa TaxID=2508721 RepID=A0A4Q1D7U0_9BACT|nr:hypothetical protein [Filimonas effusa]RXK83777.1 hypothetical protein ESB13_17030 [Filimonas effusa]
MKLKMPFFLLVLLTGALCLSSCSQDDETLPDYLQLKINGSTVRWTKGATEVVPQAPVTQKTNFSLTGNNDSSNVIFFIGVEVNGSTLAPGTYSSDDYMLPVSYGVVGAGNTFVKEFTSTATIDGQPKPKYVLTIKSVTDQYVTGSFTGNLLIDAKNKEVIEITEGEFMMPRLR